MEFKYSMKRNIDIKIPAWVFMEIWNILHEIENTRSYNTEDIKELRNITDQKIEAIQSSAKYQIDHFGKSKYDL